MILVMWVCEISTAADSNRFTKGWGGFTESALNSTFFSLNRRAPLPLPPPPLVGLLLPSLPLLVSICQWQLKRTRQHLRLPPLQPLLSVLAPMSQRLPL